MKTLDQYNQFVDSICYDGETLHHLAIEFGGECGELLGEIGKEGRSGGVSRRDNILLEGGDVLFNLTYLMKKYGFTLEDVANANVKKLEQRHRIAGVTA